MPSDDEFGYGGAPKPHGGFINEGPAPALLPEPDPDPTCEDICLDECQGACGVGDECCD